ncbi:MAG: DUF3445 domain-containing protein [Pseudomonadota bacterium]|nr:DUF3445 domain-containing protein [Pseudomonadota bacterium]
MPYICQKVLPISPWVEERTRRLPGTQQIKDGKCFLVDDAFASQMKYKEQLLSTKKDCVYKNFFQDDELLKSLLEHVIDDLKKDKNYQVKGDTITRPDNKEININMSDSLLTASMLVQEDMLVLVKEKGQHVLKAGVLCFPASWTLEEKMNRSLTSIHSPVAEYEPGLANRIEKMVTNLRPNIHLWRANFLLYDDFELFQPRRERDEKGNPHKTIAKFLRVERQTFSKLKNNGALIFTIHTFVIPFNKLSEMQRSTILPYITAL